MPRRLDRRQRIEVRGVPVVPAEVQLVDGLRVVPDGAVVIAGREPGPQRRRQAQLLGDLLGRMAGVREPQRLVVDEEVDVALLGEEVGDAIARAFPQTGQWWLANTTSASPKSPIASSM